MSDLATKLATYQPSPQTVDLIRATSILFIVGISGSGKDTIIHKLIERGNYYLIISHTTRHPRINQAILEKDGLDYHFITLEKAEDLVDAKAFVEAKIYSGNVYGTTAAEIQKAQEAHKIAITALEVQGVAAYKAIDVRVKAAFILPPSYDEWQARIRKRYGLAIDPADYQKRMEAAVRELEEVLDTDYYACFVNDDLEKVTDEIDRFAVSGERDDVAERQARELAKQLLEEARDKLSKL